MKTRILLAAIEEIHIHGLRFTMSDLTKRLRVSKTSLYEYFSSKNDLIKALILLVIEDLQEQEDKISTNSMLSIPEKIHASLRIIPQSINPYKNQLYDEFIQYYPEESKYLEEYMQLQINNLKALLTQGIATNVIRPININVFCQMVLASTKQLLSNQFINENNMTLHDAVSHMVDILMSGLLPKSD